MSVGNYIILHNYYHFKSYEDILMSLIVGLHNSKQVICFSNEYAALKCKVSQKTISLTISKFIELGYIECRYIKQGRVITLLNTPKSIDLKEECELETPLPQVKETITTGNEPLPQVKGDITTGNEGITTGNFTHYLVTTNNIDNNIDNTYATAQASVSNFEGDNRFMDLVRKFPQNKHKGVQEAYDYIWQFLSETEKQQVEKFIPVYIQRNSDTPKFIKPINKYFNERYWLKDDITESLINNKKTTKFVKPKIIL